MDFNNIPKKYRPIPFWSWNAKLEVEETKEQVHEMDDAGIGGFFMHARGGLQTEYMSDEWFANVEAAIKTGEEIGMSSWAYDENGWPSGFGNGYVNGKGIEYQQKYLRMSDDKPCENVLGKCGEHWFYFDVNPFYVDVLNKKVVAEFIEYAYTPYYQKYGNCIEGFFTDEPQISRNGIPWSFVFAEEYNAHRNVTIIKYQKLLYTMSGQTVPDVFSSNFKIPSKFFKRFITQEVQYLLGNGVTFENESTKDKLGTKFEQNLQKLAKYALIGGVSFGFWNLDHIDIFKITEFVPLYDEVTGALRAGVRFWQIDENKPLRATLYEEDGYTEYIWNQRSSKKGEILQDKRPYKISYGISEADGVQIYDGKNYESFPIVPLYGNESRQSELVGLREEIDAYDLIKSGFANTVDESSIVYWLIQNAEGMDDVDIVNFLQKIRTIHGAVVDESGATAEPHTIDVPFESREALLERLRADLYEDAMALDTKNIANGAITATQIKASYELLNQKCDEFEYEVTDFIESILSLAGIDDTPTFTRSNIVNVSEMIQVVLQSASYLENDYVTEKVMTYLGDGDRVEEALRNITAEEIVDYGNDETEEPNTEEQLNE